MADEIGTKVSQLPLGENLADSDLMYAVEGGISKKVEVGYLKNRLVGNVDSAPTQGSINLVQSGGVYTALSSKADASAIPTELADLSEDSTHRVVTDAEKTAWDAKANVEANPLGEATAELTKIGINNIIYKTIGGEKIYGEASGAIASFSDGSDNPLVKLEADINPIQDLHGYDKPWAAGAGKNKLPSSNAINTTLNGITFKTSGDGIYEVSGTATAGTNCEFTFSQAVSLVAGKKVSFFNNFTGYNLFFRKDGSDKTYYNFSSANRTVTIASADAVEFDTLRITVESGATINGKFALMMYEGDTTTTYEPYSNICPISGRSSVEVTAAGKNILPTKFYNGIGYNISVGTILAPTELDDVTQSGNTYSRDVSGWYGFGMITDYLPNGTYYLSSYLESPNMRSSIYVIDSNMKVVRNLGNVAPGTTRTIANSITLSGDEHYIAFSCLTSVDGTVKITEPQITVGSTATSYEAYNADTETISLGQTIYGGKLNVTTGELTVDRAFAELDGSSDENWMMGSSSGHYRAYIKIDDIESYSGAYSSISQLYICSIFENGSWNNVFDGNPKAAMTGQNWGFGLDSFSITTDTELREWLSTNNIQIAYKLATPTTISLTPTQVSSLLGSNNIWADSGDVDVVYIRDLNLFLNQLDARVKALENA